MTSELAVAICSRLPFLPIGQPEDKIDREAVSVAFDRFVEAFGGAPQIAAKSHAPATHAPQNVCGKVGYNARVCRRTVLLMASYPF